MTDAQSPRRITVHFTRRDDGGLRAYSDDIPEFYIAGPNPRNVLDNVIPVMRKILEINYKEQLQVIPAEDFAAVALELGIDQGPAESRALERDTLKATTAKYLAVRLAA